MAESMIEEKIRRLLVEAEKAFDSKNWTSLFEHAEDVLLLDGNNRDSRTYRDAANKSISGLVVVEDIYEEYDEEGDEDEPSPLGIFDEIRIHIRSHVPSYVGIAIAVVSLALGLAVTLYFSLQPDKSRHPQLSIGGDPLLVYDPELTTAFLLEANENTTLLFGQEKIEESVALNQQVWAVKFAVWNSGELDIQPGDVISKNLAIDIGSPDEQPTIVWEVRTTALSREEIGFRLLTAEKEEINGFLRVPLDFAFLRKNDGAEIQVTYSGSKNIPVNTSRGSERPSRVRR